MNEPIDIHAKTYEDGYRDASQEGRMNIEYQFVAGAVAGFAIAICLAVLTLAVLA